MKIGCRRNVGVKCSAWEEFIALCMQLSTSERNLHHRFDLTLQMRIKWCPKYADFNFAPGRFREIRIFVDAPTAAPTNSGQSLRLVDNRNQWLQG